MAFCGNNHWVLAMDETGLHKEEVTIVLGTAKQGIADTISKNRVAIFLAAWFGILVLLMLSKVPSVSVSVFKGMVALAAVMAVWQRGMTGIRMTPAVVFAEKKGSNYVLFRWADVKRVWLEGKPKAPISS